MSKTPPLAPANRRLPVLLILSVCLFAPCALRAESLEANSSLGLWDLDLGHDTLGAPPATMSPSRGQRIRLFCIAPGFLSEPIGLQDDDSGLPGVPSMPGSNLPSAPAQADGPEWVQFGMGNDNPNLDLRRPGDPGGVGYYRLNTQVQLFDSPTTSCAFGLQAVAPAGIQFAGMPDGPTVFSPAFSVFHSITENTAIQGFVAKNVPVSGADGTCFLQRSLQCGMAVQRPLSADGPEALRSVFLSVGALGAFRPDHGSLTLLPTYDVLPGVQWHVNDTWWLSSGVLVPVGPVRTAPSQWQLTCSLQF
ncbi:MAG TPA: hypothetical protein VH643_16870 [Gemmataceae bacterium]|jgi:hypothetical protein